MSFRKQLEKRLPAWSDQGWVTTDNARQILAYEAEHEGHGPKYLTLAFSLLGVILFGSGVITFFAANWQEMTKLTKLGVLFGALWLSYGLAWFFEQRQAMPWLAQAMLLLGVILFGSNIMLIAQIYHISEHFPNGVLLWALGGVLVAYLAHSQPAMVAALGLGLLWTWLESEGYWHTVHWPFLAFLALPLWPIVHGRWHIAMHVAMIGLLLWSLFTFFAMADYGYPQRWATPMFLTQVYFLAYLALFIVAMALERLGNYQRLPHIVQRYAAFAALTALYPLTFPRLLDERFADTGLWLGITLAAAALVVASAWWHRRLTAGGERPAFLAWGWALLAVLLALMLINLADPGRGYGLLALAFNLAYFGALLWLLYAAVHGGNRWLVNQAFFFFALTLLARYFDTFWTLMDRSLFFMGGGLALLFGGWWLEQQRRRLTREITAQREGAL